MADEVILGVDYGTARIAIAGPSIMHFEEVVLRPGDNLGALDVLAETLWNAVKRTHADVVVVESPIQGASRNVRVGISLGMVAGAICVAARQAGASVLLVPPATWKKTVVGHGNANKEQVAQWLQSEHPDLRANAHSQDLVDATCIALSATRQVDE
jgi:Holliday junction resolvasome RuvABC endonuclease subunit